MPDEGFRKWLAPNYEVMKDGHSIVSLTIREEMRNLRGVVQGGVVASLVDISMATAACGGNYDTRLRPMTTMELKVNYTAAATGNCLTATADVIRAGNRTSVVRCEIRREDGEVCAAGLGTFMIRRVHSSDPKDMAVAPDT